MEILIAIFLIANLCCGIMIGMCIGFRFYYRYMTNKLNKLYDEFCDLEYNLNHVSKN